MSHLLLQLKNAIHQRLGRRRASRHVDIHRHDPVAASGDRVAVVVVTSAVCATAHGNDPPRLGHLVVDLSQSRGHLVGEGAGYNHDVGLARGGSENYTKTILVVAGGGEMHHFDGTAGESEGHGPEGALSCPVGDLIECGTVQGALAAVLPIFRRSVFIPKEKSTYRAYCIAPFLPSWLGNGTSRRSAFIGGGVPGFPATNPGFCIVVALFEEVEDIKAALPARKGIRAVVGLTAHISLSEWGRFWVAGAPRRAIEAPYRAVDSILATRHKRSKGVEREEGQGGVIKDVVEW
jgi:hypothetical protein